MKVAAVSDNPPPVTTPQRRFQTTLWVLTTYFAEGYPFRIIKWLSQVYFSDIGAKEAVIGYLNWLGLPWNVKFLWAPLVDLRSTKRAWLVGVELLLALGLAALALFAWLGPPGQGSEAGQPAPKLDWAALSAMFDPLTGLSIANILLAVVLVFIVLAFLAATHDIAIDAYYIEGLPDRSDQAAYTGLRSMAYRLAVLFVTFAFVQTSRWGFNFALAAGTMLLITVFHAIYLPRFPGHPRTAEQQKNPTREFVRSFFSYLEQPKIGLVLAFLVLYKLGDELLFAMNSVFLLRELAVTKAQLSWLTGAVGATSTIVGTMLGAYWIKRWGLKRAFFPIALLMNVTIWAYVWLAWAKPQATSPNGFLLISLVHGYEQLAAGIGSASLTVFLIYTCKPEFKAAHFAVGSAIMTLGYTFIGGFAGLFVERYGYVALFSLSFFASIPAMVLLFRLPLDQMLARKD